MAPTWERIAAGSVRAALHAPELRVAWSFVRAGEALAYRFGDGTVALVLPLGGWLADRQAGIEWAPAPAASGVARGESLALLEGAVGPEDLEQLRATAGRDGVNVMLLSVPPPTPAPAEAVPTGTLTLAPHGTRLSLPVYRVGDPAPTLHESPAAMRKRGEGPGNLRERERWFRSRSGPGR